MDTNYLKEVPTNTVTRELTEFANATGNIYESTMIIAKRSNQIAADIKQELSHKLEEFANYADTLEETFENKEQIEISRYYEKLPKPTLIAIKEFQDGKIYYRMAEDESDKAKDEKDTEEASK
ncbi:MAG: DNA-directed RNA polymerase subunit omega [Bacteroidales bacterium]|jgi:DNA-directed RNA polymerase subunit K/omega|nr:DNA-directed RNA polymerase subunit omega [Bacteroidales bacterium]MCI2122042.1 DNA-directed RNA polymerase subunit omega [Bacteroidales bacterium]MCI2145339.1 DNA-directed RNA polymerase subunit omega [Bacteroidales bacterium]